MKKMFDQRNETLILFPFVLHDQIVCTVLCQERYGNGILFVKMLFYDKIGEGFVNALKFGVEGTIVELYLFDDRGAFDVVVVRTER